ncbi:putative ribonuclease H-like domain-containing protein, partial [Tanacetum coccineum]
MLQEIISQLAILGENISQEDLNLKFLRSLPSEWNTHVVVWRNKPDLESISFDDLYNNFKIVEQEVKRTVSIASSSVSTDSTQDNTASLSDDTIYAFLANQPNGSELVHENLEQIHEDDLEEMDLKWQLALLSMRARKYYQRTRKKITINGSDTAGYDKSKVECFNCHKMGHFARECRGTRNQESMPRNQDSSRRTVNSEDTKFYQSMVGLMMSWLDCLKSFEALKTQLDNLRVEFNKSEFNLATYKRDASFKDSEINALKIEIEKLKNEKESNQIKINKFENASKSLDKLIGSQILDNSREGTSNKVKTTFATPLVEELVSEKEKQIVFPTKIEFVKQQDKTARKPVKLIVNTIKGKGWTVNTAQPKSTVYSAKPMPKAVNTARPNSVVVNTVRANQENVVKASACWGNPPTDDQGYVDSGCFRHMTGNISYLSDFQEFDGGYVTFGGGVRGGKITGKGTLKMGKLDFQDVFFVTLDESMLWHRRLGHINFKTINKLVMDNLVRSLPSKRFENDQTYVAFLKRKQHKASCRTPALNFMRPFGCHVSILNTLYHLGKFDGKSDNGFFVGYSLTSKAFRVYNIRTRRVEENLHIRFLEDKPIVSRDGLKWLFDLDSLTKSMNYVPFIADSSLFDSPSMNVSHDEPEASNDAKKRDDEGVNIFSLRDNVTPEASNADLFGDEIEIDMSNLNTSYQVPTTPNTRIHKDHLLDHVIGDIQSGVQTRGMNKTANEQGFLSAVYEGKTHEDLLTSRIVAIRLFLAYASFMGFMVYQMDVKSAFIYGQIEEEVYVCQPPGFEDPDYPNKVYKVVKALYGLHQAPKAWYETLTKYLLDNGFHRGKINQTLFIKKQKRDILLLQIYVNDSSTKKELCLEFEKLMHDKFQMSSMGELTFFLDVKTASTPMDTEKPLLKDSDGDDVDVHIYRSMIGSLMYLTSSRLDIMFAVYSCLWYLRNPFELVAYYDSDYAGASLDRKSTTG